jgi:predicted NUDIX family NTP pyrophosphohydrolase
VDNFEAARPQLVDKSIGTRAVRPIWFVLPEGAGGTDAGLVSDDRTGSPDRRSGDRKVDEAEVTGAAAAGPSLLGSVAGVEVRYGSFGRFRVRRVCSGSPMPKLSAGLLLYRRSGDDIQVLVAHPGGPIWSRRDAGAWSLPKGAANEREELLDAARREFEEETGHAAPDARPIDLGEVRMRSGKVVHAWAVEGDLEPARIQSMTVEVEWPPKSGRRITVPEIDRVLWADPAEARRRLNPAQSAFVDRLLQALAGA